MVRLELQEEREILGTLVLLERPRNGIRDQEFRLGA